MFSKIAYPLFGFLVLGVYGVSTFAGSDISAINARRSRIPSQYLGGAYRDAPVVWRSSFHGPGPAPVARTTNSSSRRRGGSYAGGYYGGFGGGK